MLWVRNDVIIVLVFLLLLIAIHYAGLHTKHVASLVKPTQGKLKWFLDIDAAAQLPQ